MKTNKIFFWMTTGIVAAFFFTIGSLYLSHNAYFTAAFQKLGLPDFMMNILGTAKVLGAIALIQPMVPKLREWAYAGFSFVLIGATWVHIVTGQSPVAPLVFAMLLGVSYYFNMKMNDARTAN